MQNVGYISRLNSGLLTVEGQFWGMRAKKAGSPKPEQDAHVPQCVNKSPLRGTKPSESNKSTRSQHSTKWQKLVAGLAQKFGPILIFKLNRSWSINTTVVNSREVCKRTDSRILIKVAVPIFIIHHTEPEEGSLSSNKIESKSHALKEWKQLLRKSVKKVKVLW